MPDHEHAPCGLAIGVDLGGTKIAAGLFDAEGGSVGRLESMPTEAAGPRERTLQNLYSVIESAFEQLPQSQQICGIGVGSTGPLDPLSGKLLEADSLPNLCHYALAADLQARFQKPVFLTNDGNAFALAEARHGAGRGRSIVAGVTIGTGCGCGIVIGGKILEGATANTGELYRATLAGRTFDEALSGRGLERLFREKTGREAAGKEIARLAQAGDLQACAVFDSFGHVVGEGLSLIAAVLDPTMIVLGGSVSESLYHFLPTLRVGLSRHVAPRVAECLKIAPAKLGRIAGALGAASLVFASETIR